MTMLEKTYLSRFASDYLISCLHEGMSLSTHTLNLHSIEQGKIFTYLPSNTPPELLYHFSSGTVINQSGARAKVAEFIRDFLSRSDRCYAVLENQFSSLGSLPMQRNEYCWFTYLDSEVYTFLDSKDLLLEKITRTLTRSGGYPSIGILTTLSDSYPFIENNQNIKEDLLRNLAENLQFVLVGAYDEENYLIWQAQ